VTAKREPERKALLRIREPGRPERLEDLVRDRYAVGRGEDGPDSGVDFRLQGDSAVSRLHFVLSRDDGTYAIENRSANETEVNGRLLAGPRRLEHGDRVRVGERTEIEYLLLSAAERSRQLESLGAGRQRSGSVVAAGKRPLLRRPWVWALLVLYGGGGLVALAILGASADATHVADPGLGPYFAWMEEKPLGSPGPREGARDVATAMWTPALVEHGGERSARNVHDYLLLL
jgi:hypothetical protein